MNDPSAPRATPGPLTTASLPALDSPGRSATPSVSTVETTAPGEQALDRLALTQGTLFLATGLWALLHRASFERVTGRRGGGWGVLALGALVAGVGGALLLVGRRGRASPQVVTLAAGAELGERRGPVIEHEESSMDESLMESFPASDPPAHSFTDASTRLR